jgi:hypothetical protein
MYMIMNMICYVLHCSCFFSFWHAMFMICYVHACYLHWPCLNFCVSFWHGWVQASHTQTYARVRACVCRNTPAVVMINSYVDNNFLYEKKRTTPSIYYCIDFMSAHVYEKKHISHVLARIQ